MFEKLGRFEIKGLIGHGAMGEVYLGYDPSIGREVAIKTLLARPSAGEEARQRLAREARAAGLLNHPNIVTVHEFGEDQGVLYIAMERMDGQDLEELLRQGSLAPGEILEVLAQVCDGLGFAHRNHVIHRDIKPSNVRVLRDGHGIRAKIMDFGVARMKDSESTATGTVVGTVSYMAPEYIRTGRPDGRSDLFAVGVMLHECISGRRPFDGDTTPTILYRIVNEPPDPLDLSRVKEISPALLDILEKALAKNPEARYQTADELARALRAAKEPAWRAREGDPGTSLDVPPETEALPPQAMQSLPTAGVPRPGPVRSRWALAAVLVAAASLGALAGGGALFYRTNHPRRSPVPLRSGGRLPAPRAASVGKPAGPSSPSTEGPALPAAVQALPAEGSVPSGSGPLRPGPESPEPSSPAQKNLTNLTLSDAIRAVDSDPAQAIESLRTVVAADPGNANAHAWLVVALYEGGRYQEIPGVLARARRRGITRATLSNNLRFRMVMQDEQAKHRIPGGTGGDE